MPVMRTYQCGECGHRVDVLHMARDEPPPATCEACAGGEPHRQMSAPHIAGIAGKAGDQVYREMEVSSQRRAEAVAAQFGESASTTGIGITNLRSNMRQGDIAAMPSGGPPATMMPQSAAIEYARQTTSGPEPYAGMRYGMTAVSAMHERQRRAVVAQGQKG